MSELRAWFQKLPNHCLLASAVCGLQSHTSPLYLKSEQGEFYWQCIKQFFGGREL
jgi:hypothetical protein